jgi:hypothetical protein
LALLIVLIIIGAFGVGLWAALRLWRLLPIEERALQEVQQRCQELRQRGVTSDDVDIADALTARLTPATALICTRIQTIHDLHQRGADIPREALAATAAARFSLETSILRYVSGILILIGLMGTLVGLTQAVLGLNVPEMAAVGKEDTGQHVQRLFTMVDKLSNTIRETLAGMRTAFFASLVAVSLTIVLSLCAHLLHHRQTVFLTALEDCTTCDILLFFVPAKIETVLDTLVRALQQGIQQVSGSVEELDSRAIIVGDKLEYLFNVVQAFDTWRKQFEDTLGQAARNHLDLQEMHRVMQRTTDVFFQALDRLHTHEELQEQALVQLQTFCTANTGLPTTIQQTLQTQQRLQEGIADFAAKCDDLLGRRLTDLLHQHHQRILGWSETHDRFNQRLLTSLDQGAAWQEAANSMWREFMVQYRQAEQHTTAQATDHTEQMARLLAVNERQCNLLRNLDQAMKRNLLGQSEMQDAFKLFIELMVGTTPASTSEVDLSEDKPALPLLSVLADGFRTLLEGLQQERAVFLETLEHLQSRESDFQQQSLHQHQQLVQLVQDLLTPPPRRSFWR